MPTRREPPKTRDSVPARASKLVGPSGSQTAAIARGRSAVHRAAVAVVVNGLRRIVGALHQSHRVAEQRWDLSAAQLLVLQRLAEFSTLSVNELADLTFTHQSTVSVVVARLVGRGLVRRARSNDDLRRVELALTPAGRVLLHRAMSSAQMRLIETVDAMPTTQLRTLGAGLQRLVQALGVAGTPAGMFFEDDAIASQDNNAKSPKRRRG